MNRASTSPTSLINTVVTPGHGRVQRSEFDVRITQLLDSFSNIDRVGQLQPSRIDKSLQSTGSWLVGEIPGVRNTRRKLLAKSRPTILAKLQVGNLKETHRPDRSHLLAIDLWHDPRLEHKILRPGTVNSLVRLCWKSRKIHFLGVDLQSRVWISPTPSPPAWIGA